MTVSTLFFVLLVLACPLMMVWMMRGGHGHSHGHGKERGRTESDSKLSVADLRSRRDELDKLIEKRERSENGTRATTGSRR